MSSVLKMSNNLDSLRAAVNGFGQVLRDNEKELRGLACENPEVHRASMKVTEKALAFVIERERDALRQAANEMF